MNKLEFKGVSKIYGGGYSAIAHASFTLNYGDRLLIIGDARSGKTTLGKLISGLERATGGEISADGGGPPGPEKDNIGYFTTEGMKGRNSVFSTLEYPLKLRGMSADSIDNALELFGVSNIARLKIKDLDRVQRVSVALARLFVVERDLYVLDNPFGDLPCSERSLLARELAQALDSVKGAAVILTDSVEEAVHFGAEHAALLCYGRLSPVKNLNEHYLYPPSIAEAKMLCPDANAIALAEEGRPLLQGDAAKLIPHAEPSPADGKEDWLSAPLIGKFSSIIRIIYPSDIKLNRGEFTAKLIESRPRLADYINTLDFGGVIIKAASLKRQELGIVKFDIEGTVKLFDAKSEQAVTDYRKMIKS